MADDALNDAEKAYFESAGRATAGLAPDPAARPAPDAGTAQPAQDAAPQQSPQPQATPPHDDDKQTDKTVSLGKYLRTEEELKGLKKQFSELQDKYSRGDERLRLLVEAMSPQGQQQPAEEPEPELPDPEQDIFGFARALQQRYDTRVARLEERLGEASARTQGIIDENQLRENYVADAQRFARQTPDFVQAYQHLIGSRDAELTIYGVANPAERRRMIFAEERDLVSRAIREGRSPAEVVYKLAQGRGFAPPAANGAAGSGAAQNGTSNGLASGGPPATAANATANAATPNVTEEIARIQAGQAAGKTLSAGGSTPATLSVQALADMSEAEFEALYRKNPDLVRRMMAGQVA